MKGSGGCVHGTEGKNSGEGDAALLQNASSWSVNVTAVTPAESEYCQSTVGPLGLSDNE